MRKVIAWLYAHWMPALFIALISVVLVRMIVRESSLPPKLDPRDAAMDWALGLQLTPLAVVCTDDGYIARFGLRKKAFSH